MNACEIHVFQSVCLSMSNAIEIEKDPSRVEVQYIQKAKRFADSAFCLWKIAEKVRKSWQHKCVLHDFFPTTFDISWKSTICMCFYLILIFKEWLSTIRRRVSFCVLNPNLCRKFKIICCFWKPAKRAAILNNFGEQFQLHWYYHSSDPEWLL